MGRLLGVLGICGSVKLSVLPALADELKAPDYAGISYMYYSLIVAILGGGLRHLLQEVLIALQSFLQKIGSRFQLRL